MRTMFILSILLTSVNFMPEAKAREADANFTCVASGRRIDGQYVEGRIPQRANLGKRGSNVFPTFDDICRVALESCVSQFHLQHIGIQSCRVTQALLQQDGGQSHDYQQYHGRQLPQPQFQPEPLRPQLPPPSFRPDQPHRPWRGPRS